jgi:maleate isomerase
MNEAATAAAWPVLPCRLDDGLELEAAIGLIVNAGDAMIEPDMRRFLPRPGAELYATRIPFEPRITPESLAAMGASIEGAVRLLLPGERLDVVAFGCTSAAIAIGPAKVAGLVHAARPGVCVTDPMSAALAAMRALSMRRVAVITPYPDSVNAMIAGFLAAAGLDVPVRGTFRAPESVALGRTPPSRVSPASIVERAVEIGRGPVDGVFLSCTGLRAAHAITAIEEELGKPVVTSNQALAWHALQLTGLSGTTDRFGALFATRLAE